MPQNYAVVNGISNGHAWPLIQGLRDQVKPNVKIMRLMTAAQ
jgi:hypothetical protein